MADASDILDRVEAVLTALYPDVPVRQRKGRPGRGDTAEDGFQNGDPRTVFVLSCGEPEALPGQSFEEYLAAYPVRVDYLTPTPKPSPRPIYWDEDDAVRTLREAVLDALWKPGAFPALTRVFHVGYRPAEPYAEPAPKLMQVTSWVFEVVCWRRRPS